MESNQIRKIKVGPRLREDFAKIMTLDEKQNGRSASWHLEAALEKHFKSLGLIGQNYVYDGHLEKITIGGQLTIDDV